MAMSTKDVTDLDVCRAYADAKAMGYARFPHELLAERTGQCEKVCFRAMERAERRGFVEYGVSRRLGWLTEKGQAFLAQNERAANAP